MQFSHDDMHHGPVNDGQSALPDVHDAHHLWLKAVLLAVWVVFSFGVCFFARDLQAWVQGWQLGYWMAAQGAVLMFIVIAVVYCVVMDRLERAAQRRSTSSTVNATVHAPHSQP